MLTRRAGFLACWIVAVAAFAGCTTAPKTEEGKTTLQSDADMALSRAKAEDPSLTPLLDNSAGYAVFPKVGKGAVGVGGAYGKGILYQNGTPAGYCDLSQASVGLALGGQTYTEVIVFKTPEAIDRFKRGQFAFDAQATAVALKSGAGENAKFEHGVAVFTLGEKGLMAEASVGGQKFDYRPKE
ncbi:MAG TPA: YSC84-related protein [Tepidisphaeraceae bacterium]|jgi:lipid-binding SYLF domain-containing protein|nr:YSC84-related protein [Tepidisphaeraceae bacterium]